MAYQFVSPGGAAQRGLIDYLARQEEQKRAEQAAALAERKVDIGERQTDEAAVLAAKRAADAVTQAEEDRALRATTAEAAAARGDRGLDIQQGGLDQRGALMPKRRRSFEPIHSPCKLLINRE